MVPFQSLRIFNKLKSVYRFNSVEERKESVAEHTCGCLFLADYFLTSASYNLDRVKVYELLMYHDVVEIESGDVTLLDEVKYFGKKIAEAEAAKSLGTKIPSPIGTKFMNTFDEFQNGDSQEAFFARAIDALEAEIHELDYKKDWVGWTKEYLVDKKLYKFEKFPEMKKMFEEIVLFLEKNDYFDMTK